jgi:(2S)-methylsuccinyl-CoA dehydrogenase
MTRTPNPRLSYGLAGYTTAATIAPLRALLETAKDCVRDKVMVDGQFSGALLEAE